MGTYSAAQRPKNPNLNLSTLQTSSFDSLGLAFRATADDLQDGSTSLELVSPSQCRCR